MTRPEDRRRKNGFLQERLWVVLLPALVLASLSGSTWGALSMRHAEESRRIDEVEQRLKSVIHGLGGHVGHAVETDNRERYKFLVESLAQVAGGRATLHHREGGLLAEGDRDVRRNVGGAAAGVQGNIAREIIVWGPVMGAGGRNVGELRVHVPIPPAPPFPWSVWSSLLAVFCLLSAAVLVLVTRVLSPLGRLGKVLRSLGERSAWEVQVPEQGLAEFGQLRAELDRCVEALRERQSRAEESFVEVAFALAREYEYHREGAIGHGQRTRRYAAWIAERLRLPPKERDALEVASLCHDIGKVPVDDDSLGGESAERMHPILGAAYFEAMPGLENVAKIIRAHHESFDGSGFPNGLEGDAIPAGARILRIADAFERLYADETSGCTLEEVLDEMKERAGTEFDPHFFEFFREEVAVHMLERRRRKVTLRAYQNGKSRQAELTAD